MDIWIRKLENYSITKKKETRLLGQETELQITLLVEISQTHKTNIRVFSHMCKLDFFLSRRELILEEKDDQQEV